MVRRMTSNLTQGPSRGSLQMILRLVDQGILQGRNTLRHHHGQSQGFGERSDVSQGHDTRQAVVSTGLGDIVHHSSDTTSVDDELRQIRRVTCDFANAGGGVLPHELVNVLQAMQDTWEDLGLHNNLGQIHRMLGNLSQAAANLTLERCIVVRDVLCQEGHGTCIHHGLCQFFGVPGNVAQGPGCCFLHRGIELFQAIHQSLQGAGVDHGLRQLRRVLRHRPQHEGGGLLVEAVLLCQRVDQLRQDFVSDH
mmetsp:Transcript_33060/g.67673  ORF Transcript_33060/g.67673 Transcript_33060/m.67673 type:complete len:251 (-) Transcript_33060:260-1012(-)